ncbi:hypothetical protein CVT24_009551 [Panaeolus cyanescens]|uniref:Endopeptidase S2P n=1 Tax=Panaeolus cyanescens TaxID=181874 RepID=A0A409YAE4_9AGAR|nr:hypothetical protein CVT24_009551 [Panaeolus cyanescens]
MSFGGFVLCISVTWCLIYLIHYRYNNKKAQGSLLPSQPQRHAGPILTRGSTQISLTGVHLRVSTTYFNALHDTFAGAIAKRKHSTSRNLISGLYTAGSVLSIIGALLAIGVLLWTWATLISNFITPLIAQPHANASSSLNGLVRRAFDDAGSQVAPSGKSSGSLPLNITPIIPGVTVPMTHFPLLLIAVFVSQVLHEAGHAIAGAIESLPMTSCGAYLLLFIPAAFVSFSQTGFKNLNASARLRITAAGPFHNLLLWWFLAVFAMTPLPGLLGFFTGYKTLNGEGVVVVGIAETSPLSSHIPTGAIIRAIDDDPVSSELTWTQRLIIDEPNITEGWCIDVSALGGSNTCCTPSKSTTDPTVCFTSIDNAVQGCLDPINVMTGEESADKRCKSSSTCGAGSVCSLPNPKETLTRIVFQSVGVERDTTILWKGPRDEIWEEVQVSDWIPRVSFLPLWAPQLIGTFWNYLTMATLSLFFFNLLPIPHLDGQELMESALEVAFSLQNDAFIYDIEALETGDGAHETTRRRRRIKDKLSKGISYGTLGVFLSCIPLVAINLMKK